MDDDKKVLSQSALTGSNVESWVERHQGVKYVCFRNGRGELFHFKQNQLMRGKPKVPFQVAEEFTRSSDVLTLENASHLAGMSRNALAHAVRAGQLNAVKKKWRYGTIARRGLFVTIDELQNFLARRSIEKYKGKMIEWDMEPRKILEGLS